MGLLGVVGLVLGLVLMPYPYHASFSIEWNFSSTCNQVSDLLEAQMKAWEGDALCPNVSDTCPKMPCGQKCLYKVVSSSEGTLVGEHQTPVARYVDDLTFSMESTATGCDVKGHSTSRTWYAVLDLGTNSCNLRNLVDGSGLSAEKDFTESTRNSVCTQYESRDCSRFYARLTRGIEATFLFWGSSLLFVVCKTC